MISFKNLSIKSKITWVIMLTSCTALLIACLAFVGHELLTFRQALVLEMSTLADAIGKHSASSLSTGMTNYGENTLAALRLQKQIIAAALYKDGKIWAKFPKERADAAFPTNVTAESHQFRKNSFVLT